MRIFNSVAMLFILAGCSTVTYQIQTDVLADQNVEQSHRQVALFLDGTANDIDSRTNVAKLSEIVRNQNKKNLHVFYNEGVGTGYRLLGGGTGWGIDKDVAEAYAFLTYAYKKDSELYLFGFSRGAYTARILAGMIYSVGIYDFSDKTESERLQLSEQLYSDYKKVHKLKFPTSDENSSSSIPSPNNCTAVEEMLFADECEIALAVKHRIGRIAEHRGVRIKVMGIWDTVEALGVIPTIEAISRNFLGIEEKINVINPNPKYIDQICNIDHVYHALALDDNREYVFTPISIKSDYVVARCGDRIKQHQLLGNVKEVWFSGAHADVGGGYSPLEQQEENFAGYVDLGLSGVSLNWMIRNIESLQVEGKIGLLPTDKKVGVLDNFMGYLHDAQNNSRLYEEKTREEVFLKYCDKNKIMGYSTCVFDIHESALDRVTYLNFLKMAEEKPRKPNYGTFNKYGFDSQWYRMRQFSSCFEPADGSRFSIKLAENCNAIRIIKD